jgi:hypothetical protein
MTADEFITAELSKTQTEMSTPILNRGHWDVLREHRQMLVFLQQRTQAVDFQGLRLELRRIADGIAKVPQISGPRRRAEECLQHWGEALDGLEPRQA